MRTEVYRCLWAVNGILMACGDGALPAYETIEKLMEEDFELAENVTNQQFYETPGFGVKPYREVLVAGKLFTSSLRGKATECHVHLEAHFAQTEIEDLRAYTYGYTGQSYDGENLVGNVAGSAFGGRFRVDGYGLKVFFSIKSDKGDCGGRFHYAIAGVR